MTLAAQLYQTINATVPIAGVRIGDPANKATWSIQFVAGTSSADQATANGILAGFDPADPATVTSAQTNDAMSQSRQKDILATIAWAIRLKDTPAWNALSLAQKKATALAAADDWRDIRVFIEKNL